MMCYMKGKVGEQGGWKEKVKGKEGTECQGISNVTSLHYQILLEYILLRKAK